MLLALTPAFASAASAPAGNPNEAITSTVLRALTIAPGRSGTATVLVQNQTLRAFRFTVEPRDLRRRRDGSASTEVAPAGSQPRGAGTWMSSTDTPHEFVLEPGTQREMAIRVQVPKDAAPGGWYGAVQLLADPVAPTAAITVRTATETVFLVTVPGGRRRLDVDVDGPSGIRWHGGQATWTVRIHNDGSIHESIAGDVLLDGVLSHPQRHKLRARLLLPGETATQRIPVDLRDAPDLARARAHVARGEVDASVGGSRAVDARSGRLLVLPWWLLALVAAASAAVAWRLRVLRARRDDDNFEDELLES